MRILIDEAGPFVVPPLSQSLFSLVLVLVIRSYVEPELFAEFSQLRDGWSNQGGEVKGSKLDESQAAQLIDLVSHTTCSWTSSPPIWPKTMTPLSVRTSLARRTQSRRV